MTALRAAALILAFVPPSLAVAQGPVPVQQQSLQQRVEAKLAEAGAGTRFGLVVAAEDGRELISIAPEARFIPASNTKMFTTAAVFATSPVALGRLRQPDSAAGASVRLEGQGRRPPDVVLKGHGDARLSSALDCAANCLVALADAVAANARVVGNIVGDDTLSRISGGVPE
jgi:D-alanyl-D-alanine carboxypeptidase/D-alanyl-D-alanine-endopeptidase (penicillin-binding protein 4)